jgi:beta-lactamase class A
MQPLIKQLTELSEAQSYFTSWYLQDAATGEEAAKDSDVVTFSASTRKISIMMTALREVHAGRLSLSEELRIDNRFKDTTSGCFQHFIGTFPITVHDALIMMITVSDNVCTGTIVERLGGVEALNAFCKSVGMGKTVHRLPTGRSRSGAHPIPLEQHNVTTSADVGRLLSLILKGSKGDPASAQILGTSSDLCRLAIQIMQWQRLNDRMPMLLPDGVEVAHKTGRKYKDAGIVFKDNEPLFILSVYTNDVPDTLPDGLPGHTAASHFISTCTRMCYDYLSNDPVKLFQF